APQPELLGVGGQVEVADCGVHAAVALDLVEVVAQRLPGLALDLLGVGDDAGQVAVEGDPFGGGLRAHAGDAGEVVGALTDQCGQIGVPLGRDPVPLLDRGGGHAAHLGDALDGLQQCDAVVDQLDRVAVAGDDQGGPALVGGAGGQSGDDVVGLVV